MANSRHHGWALLDKEAKVDDIKQNMNNIMIKVRICYLKLFTDLSKLFVPKSNLKLTKDLLILL